jgi:mono/diheme cytochrome c family protein
MKQLVRTLIWIAIPVIAAVGFVYSGVYDVAADAPHWDVTAGLLATVRERSIAARANDIVVPKLDVPAMIRRGAGNYDAICAGCHLSPGTSETEMSRALYPAPPNLVRTPVEDPARTFWIIKHGIKATAMPAWGKSIDDRYIWEIVAFLKTLPMLSEHDYEMEVAASEGHWHESDEPSHEHHHEERTDRGEHGNHHDASAPLPGSVTQPAAVVDRFSLALATGNTDAAATLLDPHVLIYESGQAERSRAEYASHHLASDAEFLQSVSQRLLSRNGDAIGDLAWVASEAQMSSEGATAGELITTETMVLRKDEQGWRIVHVHWSNRSARRDGAD